MCSEYMIELNYKSWHVIMSKSEGILCKNVLYPRWKKRFDLCCGMSSYEPLPESHFLVSERSGWNRPRRPHPRDRQSRDCRTPQSDWLGFWSAPFSPSVQNGRQRNAVVPMIGRCFARCGRVHKKSPCWTSYSYHRDGCHGGDAAGCGDCSRNCRMSNHCDCRDCYWCCTHSTSSG